MPCTVEQRNRARRAVETLAAIPAVASAELVAPRTGLHDSWAVEIVVCGVKLPPRVLRALAASGLALPVAAVEPIEGGDYARAVAVAR